MNTTHTSSRCCYCRHYFKARYYCVRKRTDWVHLGLAPEWRITDYPNPCLKFELDSTRYLQFMAKEGA